ncbi:Uncharacterized small protein [Mycobacterium tuberculosis]|uniref:Uncharacterized small protein n=1 Tax=Mycobacterium tuberculosis TaxID=1773 RepID=A0A655A5L8_MYCTX|nr:Uncharacterized small protein [Mycobacterium tuberculosis]CKR31731.1 Uncharacterized small protein [Mycobacterium tuberculosis]CKR91142.1 Uncharacterized small protein [Mycobacterium tuberculosis]CKS73402.1 Uncharacterized small protein [Mycobacterium tuberculosis]CKV55113.1 Uncharacterized small protein [Mycobacterium tuberculosis]
MIEGGDGGSADPVESDRRTLRTRQLRPRRCRPATRGHPRSLPHHASAQDLLRGRCRDRRSRLDRRRVLPQRAGQRGLDRGRSGLHLHHRVPVLCAADRNESRPSPRRSRHPGRNPRRRHRLRAHRPAGGIRTPLRRHRRCRAACRTSTGHPDGLLTQQHLDCRRRGAGRMCPGLPGVVDLRAAAWPLPGSDGSRRTRRHRRSGRPRWNPGHYHHCDRGAGAGGRAGPGQEPMGRLLDRHDHPHRHLHGLLLAVPTSRAGVGSFIDRDRTAAARRCLR